MNEAGEHMKKALIAAAVTAAVAAPAASAGVVIYGQIHVSIDYSDISGSSYSTDGETTTVSSGEVYSGWDVNNRTSRIGFKGSEDLGNGLKAIWKVENEVRVTDTSDDPNEWSHNGKSGHWGSARNAYIGLAGDWGTFLYGRHDTPYKMAFYASGIEQLGDSVIDVNRLYFITEVRADDAITYISPNLNGLTFAAAVVPGEGYTNSFTGETFDGLADNYSIGVMYSNNGLKLSAGYEVLDQAIPATTVDDRCALSTLSGDIQGDCTNMMLSAGYSINAFDISGVYSKQEYGRIDMDIWAISTAYTFGNNKLIATYGQNDANLTPAEDILSASQNFTSYGIALQHMFSKRTSAYLAYAKRDFELSGTTIEGDGTLFISNELDEDVISFGMIHKF